MSNIKKIKKIKSGSCRIIKINKEALFEFIYENMIDNLECFFDLLDATNVISHHEINHETGEYMCVINDENEDIPNDIDLDTLLSLMKPTTKTLYDHNRYKEMSFDEIRSLINRR